MPNSILDGLSLIDPTGRLILATTLLTLVLAFGANLLLRARYGSLRRDLEENGPARKRFSHPVLEDIVRTAQKAARHSTEPNVQAIIEDGFQSELKGLLLAERFVRAATGLVIILGLLGTFYGLTSSIGRLVHLVSADPSGLSDVTQGVTTGLTQALTGMAVAFSNSLVGILSAVILTVLGVLSNPTDQRTSVMIRLEAHLDAVLAELAAEGGAAARHDAIGPRSLERTVADFGGSVERLEGAVARFESALQSFSSSTRDFTEFNAHLKDNVQRMSLSFGDLSDTLKTQVQALKRNDGGR